ncbi:MAG: hypothetical protein ACOX9C_02555 [Kiritimatiellia bacterium]|jgi:hypothetical protein
MTDSNDSVKEGGAAAPRRRRRGLAVLVVALLLLAWFSGVVGWLLRGGAVRWAPREGRDFRLTSIGVEAVAAPATGMVMRVSAPRLERFAAEALGWRSWLIPPKALPERHSVAGEVRIRLADDAEPTWMPFVVHVDPEARHPSLLVRMPSDMLNIALDYEGSIANKSKRRDYALGHYNLVHTLRFDTMTLHSTYDGRRPVTHRRIQGTATGLVRFRLEENWFDLRTTARVRRMELRCDLDFKKYMDGLALSYKVTLPRLEADINNLAPMFERRPTEAIRQALEKSLARPKNLERLARKRLPLYLPLDFDLDIEVFESPRQKR